MPQLPLTTRTVDEELAQAKQRIAELEKALDEWMDKTEWAQENCKPKELGLHRADVLVNRIKDLEEENKTILAWIGKSMMRGGCQNIEIDSELAKIAERNDLEQQAKGVDMAIELCESNGWSWDGDCGLGYKLETLEEQLRKQAQELKQ